MKTAKPISLTLATVLISSCVAYIAYTGASTDKDATTRTVVTTQIEALAPTLITKTQPPVSMAHPDIAQDPETIKLERLKKVFPNLQEIPSDWRTFNPQNLTIVPCEDSRIPFNLDEIKTVIPNPVAASPDARTVQVYRNAFQGGSVITAATENEMVAIVTIPGTDVFEIHVLDGDVTISTAPPGQCGNMATHSRVATQEAPKIAFQIAEANLLEFPPAALQADTYAAEPHAAETVHTSNVVFFYNDDTLTANQTTPVNESTIATTYIAQIEAANVVLANSNINNLRWNYVGAFKTPAWQINPSVSQDPELALMENAIEIIEPNSPHINSGNKAAHDFAIAKIEETSADQAVYIVVQSNTGWGGIARLGMDNSLEHTVSVRVSTGYPTLTHELGHNFGCNHDRVTYANQDEPGVTPPNTLYSFGYTYQTANDLIWDTHHGTIMSYASNRVPYFSSPLISFEGYVLGIAQGQPGAADNARHMREKAPCIKIIRDAPAIITQPQSITITEGAYLSLYITATSLSASPLTYQWKLNGNNINGGSDGAYSKTNAALTDSGTYTVTVSNLYGSVASNSAVVTVTPSGNTNAPAITTHPQSATVNQGATILLSVAATGNNLSYQWRKNDATISGAAASTYSKVAATTDAGSYTVVVSNQYGSVTSNPAIVTVNGASSGGGGGAASWLYFAAVGAIALLRRRR